MLARSLVPALVGRVGCMPVACACVYDLNLWVVAAAGAHVVADKVEEAARNASEAPVYTHTHT